ncbi:MAG TPA: peptidoglycan-binding domain 1 protein [Beijerinckiaceae bacterium]|jgi:hypothetical protein
MTVPVDWKQAAVAITPGFEVSGDPYLGVSGDFDGMGISCGALQWNIGQGSLQPMVKNVGKAVVVSAMPTIGSDMWTACTTSIPKGLAIVRSWQTGTKLKPGPKSELRALMGTPEMRAQQDQRIDKVAASALKSATDWMSAQGKGAATKRLFCWFFDLITQNGGLEGLAPKDVADFINAHGPGLADDAICNFLEAVPGTKGHAKDAHQNGSLWRNKVDDEKLEILTMSYLRSNTANPLWRHVVLNRKGTIAMGSGWVNSTKYDFAKYGL